MVWLGIKEGFSSNLTSFLLSTPAFAEIQTFVVIKKSPRQIAGKRGDLGLSLEKITKANHYFL
jgi:hypothetical protein